MLPCLPSRFHATTRPRGPCTKPGPGKHAAKTGAHVDYPASTATKCFASVRILPARTSWAGSYCLLECWTGRAGRGWSEGLGCAGQALLAAFSLSLKSTAIFDTLGVRSMRGNTTASSTWRLSYPSILGLQDPAGPPTPVKIVLDYFSSTWKKKLTLEYRWN